MDNLKQFCPIFTSLAIQTITYITVMNKQPDSIDAYIAGFPEETRAILAQVRAAIQKAAPEASETIKYAMPTYVFKGKNLVFFAGYKNHIGFYATPSGHESFKAELSKYKQGKGSVQFPIDQPMPLDLIERMVQFRVEELE
ncbi:MAG: DUF1801 domain-containing protein [Saprospiraceae bacterium]|nr:DUF1801 domain-containing protein [Saprospiraceae bacterium]